MIVAPCLSATCKSNVLTKPKLFQNYLHSDMSTKPSAVNIESLAVIVAIPVELEAINVVEVVLGLLI